MTRLFKTHKFLWSAVPLVSVSAFAVWLWWNDIASDKNYKLEVLAPISLLKEPPLYYSKANVEVGQVFPGEAVDVLRMRYGKDFRVWCVQGSKKQKGWFIEDGKNVLVSKK